MENRKEQVQQLVDDLAKSKNFEAVWIRDLIGLLLEDAKDQMIEASGEELLKYQGEARALARLQRRLRNPRQDKESVQ